MERKRREGDERNYVRQEGKKNSWKKQIPEEGKTGEGKARGERRER